MLLMYRGTIYGGFVNDLYYVGTSLQNGYPGVWALAFLDLPVSFVADTLLLPLTVHQTIEGRPADSQESDSRDSPEADSREPHEDASN